MPPVTQGLIIANAVVFLLEIAGGGALLEGFALWPSLATVLFRPWQLLSYAFLHGSLTHILFNMLGVWMFGGELERLWGGRRFAVTYFASVLSGALVQIAVGTLTGEMVPVIGASAGVFGLLLAYGLIFPNRMVLLIFPPVPMPAKVFVFVYGGLELFLGITGVQAGVAHFAHLGGMLGSWLTLRHYRGPRRRR